MSAYTSRLRAIAAKENCDYPPYDALQEAAAVIDGLEKDKAGLVSVIAPHVADLERMKGIFTEHGKGCFESTIVEIDKAIAEFRQAIKQHGGEHE